MAVIYIENKSYDVAEGKNLLETCLGLGFDIPYFCWHPAMGSAGACRQCAVKKYRDKNDKKGKIVMSCMEPVVEGLRISISDPEVREFRASIIELLMTNHPHDCPVCDEGGECHLQDMTVMTGHTYRRYEFKKRTHLNQYLGPFISHEMNRCIQCYRCVRFYRDYAGGRDLDVFSAHNHVYFGRYEEGVLQCEFSGNLVEICPTGVFTDKTFKAHYARKWDLRTAPSICVHCGLGCNTIPGERYGTIRRIRNRYNGTVNGYFLCDRGRYGYEFLNSGKRIRHILRRNKNRMEISDKNAIIRHIKETIKNSRIIGIGSPRASLESNYALLKLVGENNFYSGMSDAEHRLVSRAVRIMQDSSAFVPSLKETEKADAVLVLGEDVTNTAPMLALSLRQTLKNRSMNILQKYKIPLWDDGAVRNILKEERGALFVLTPYATKLDEVAAVKFHAAPPDIARIGFAIAHALKSDLPSVDGLPENENKIAEDIAAELKNASNPLIVSGTGCLYEPVMEAAALVADALSNGGKRAGFFLTVPECNSAGAAMMGGGSLSEAFRRVMEGGADIVIILENDLYRRAQSSAVDSFFAKSVHVIVLDAVESATTEKAEIILPAAPFTESDGTLINNEGRGQRFYSVMEPAGHIRKSWVWLGGIMDAVGSGEAKQWNDLDGIINSLSMDIPLLSGIKKLTPQLINCGDPGLRVLSSSVNPEKNIGRIPGPSRPDEKELQIVPYYSIFGSEELSALSSSIAERIPASCLLLNPDDARRIGIAEGSDALLRLPGLDILMQVKTDMGIPHGVACYPAGFPGIEFIDMPFNCEIVGA